MAEVAGLTPAGSTINDAVAKKDIAETRPLDTDLF